MEQIDQFDDKLSMIIKYFERKEDEKERKEIQI